MDKGEPMKDIEITREIMPVIEITLNKLN